MSPRNAQGQFSTATTSTAATSTAATSTATTQVAVMERPDVLAVIKSDGSAHNIGDYKFTIAVNGKPLTNKGSDTPQGYYTRDAAIKAAQFLARKWNRDLQVLPYPATLATTDLDGKGTE